MPNYNIKDGCTGFPKNGAHFVKLFFSHFAMYSIRISDVKLWNLSTLIFLADGRLEQP